MASLNIDSESLNVDCRGGAAAGVDVPGFGGDGLMGFVIVDYLY